MLDKSVSLKKSFKTIVVQFSDVYWKRIPRDWTGVEGVFAELRA